MKTINQIYIDGRFVTPHGTETLELINPTTKKIDSVVTLGDVKDTQDAIAAAKTAFQTYSQSTLEQRAEYLDRLHKVVEKRSKDLLDVMIQEYGGPTMISKNTTRRASEAFLNAKEVMLKFPFKQSVGGAKVSMEPLGVVGIITPWNASNSFISNKLAFALAAGSTVVIKPSELSAAQTQILLEAYHAADLPPGLFNLVNGRGDVVGAEITRHPDIAKITFTGSTVVGKAIARGAVDTLKRVTLELGGKSPNILLDDADFEKAVPLAVSAAYINSGQACVAGTRLFVPEKKLDEVKKLIVKAVQAVKTGDPKDPNTQIGPMVTQKQFERVQSYIHLGIQEGAELLIGGEGTPAGLESGYFVKPTVFVGVTNDMRIAREEIFGPVLSILTYKSEEEAIRMANDTDYGLQAYVSSTNLERANKVASQIVAGRVFINGLYDEPFAPFGGFKQSGLGREFGHYGLEAYLEPKATVGSNK